MEGDQREIARIWFIGKLRARAPSPIRTGYQDLSGIGRKTEASVWDSEGQSRQGDVGVGSYMVAVEEKNGKKKKNLLSS